MNRVHPEEQVINNYAKKKEKMHKKTSKEVVTKEENSEVFPIIVATQSLV